MERIKNANYTLVLTFPHFCLIDKFVYNYRSNFYLTKLAITTAIKRRLKNKSAIATCFNSEALCSPILLLWKNVCVCVWGL